MYRRSVDLLGADISAAALVDKEEARLVHELNTALMSFYKSCTLKYFFLNGSTP